MPGLPLRAWWRTRLLRLRATRAVYLQMLHVDKGSSETRILNNAVMSIQVGLQDLKLGSPGRILSAIRNLHAGVLLLLKARLAELSPENSDDVLLKQRIEPTRGPEGEVSFVGSGKKTVEAEQIRERLTSLGVHVDWRRIKALTDERNYIEHYAARITDDALRAIASSVLVIVRDFTEAELKRDPAALFGAEAWADLIRNKDVFDAERAACIEALKQIDWPHELGAVIGAYTCDDCTSPLMRVVDSAEPFEALVFSCRSCGCEVACEEFVEGALRRHYPHDEYRAVHDNVSDPLDTCPECGNLTYVAERQGCSFCGYELDYTECMVCGEELRLDDQDNGGVCSYHAEDRD